ncbi:hypothetical protein [Bacillus sp. FJAT-50079]|uniref:hypothetical protein n=1 Tax=Bacillus sp. FJAT-50079 TaxID=2833577 RepID=UPI001BCA448F|nr:hypothetical protein [Bacillus sp. FJAT-50079]MBS4207501.1 hypothetical protein [Bacillus sp. FJAT-50079]
MKKFAKVVIDNQEIIGDGFYILDENNVFVKTEEDEIIVFLRKALREKRKISLIEFSDGSVISGPLIINRIDFGSEITKIYLRR